MVSLGWEIGLICNENANFNRNDCVFFAVDRCLQQLNRKQKNFRLRAKRDSCSSSESSSSRPNEEAQKHHEMKLVGIEMQLMSHRPIIRILSRLPANSWGIAPFVDGVELLLWFARSNFWSSTVCSVFTVDVPGLSFGEENQHQNSADVTTSSNSSLFCKMLSTDTLHQWRAPTFQKLCL